MKKCKLVFVKNEEKTSQAGNAYVACSIKIEGEEFYRNGFGNSETKRWQKGQEIELELTEKEYNDKPQYGFVTPVPVDPVKKLEAKLDTCLRGITAIYNLLNKTPVRNTIAVAMPSQQVKVEQTEEEKIADFVGENDLPF